MTESKDLRQWLHSVEIHNVRIDERLNNLEEKIDELVKRFESIVVPVKKIMVIVIGGTILAAITTSVISKQSAWTDYDALERQVFDLTHKYYYDKWHDTTIQQQPKGVTR